MKILDCFLYCDEIELLELRVQLLRDYVDKFIICEANQTFSGLKRNFSCEEVLSNLNLPNEKYSIVKIILPDLNPLFPNNKSTRETMQRDALSTHIKNDEIAFVSDCDEIIDPKHLKYYASIANQYRDKIVRVPMVNLMGRANYRVFNANNLPMEWSAPFFCTSDHLKKTTISQIRNSYFDKKSQIFDNIYITENGKIFESGWHFSWMGDLEYRKKRIKFFDHNYDIHKDYSIRDAKQNPLNLDGILLKHYFRENLPIEIFSNQKIKEFLLPVKSWEDIDGFFEYPSFYKRCFEQLKDNSTVVEVGSWMGRSTAYMASLIKSSGKNIKFYSVDTWQGSTAEHGHKRWIEQLEQRGSGLYNEYLSNLTNCKLIDVVTPIRSTSTLAVEKFDDNSIDMIHIDASHEYQDVLDDLHAWYPKIKCGGLITGDDYGWPGVYKAVNEFFSGKIVLNFEHDNKHGNVWYHVKN